MRSRDKRWEELHAELSRVARRTGATVPAGLMDYCVDLLINSVERDRSRELEEACLWHAKVARSAAALLADLEAAPNDDVFEYLYIDSGGPLKEKLRYISSISSELAAELLPPRRGRKSNHKARLLADAAYFVFLGISDKPPTTTLESATENTVLFVDFLQEVFRIMRIDASPEHYAKRVVNKMRPVAFPEENGPSEPD
jgi:hypothetical protein